MRDLFALATALEVVEKNLCEQFTVKDLAKTCHISVSGLQKLFAYAFNCSVGEYIAKRRLSAAAHELLNTDKSITDISFNYRYTSPEVFSRAFKRFWGILPSTYRKKLRFSELFPKFRLNLENGGIIMSNCRKVDITELYNELKKLSGTYVLCADICNLKSINDIFGYAAGDLIIAEAARRIDSKISSEMLMFRIGRDEFVVVTKYHLIIDAESLAKKIIALNGNHVIHDGKEIPLSMRIGISQIPNGGLSYKEALDRVHDTINKAKQNGVLIGVLAE